VEKADANQNGQIEFKEFQDAVNDDPELVYLMMRADLPGNFSVNELFALMDVDGDGVLTSSEFHKEIYRLVYCNDFQRICIMQSSLNEIKQMISEVSRGLFGISRLSSSMSGLSLNGPPCRLGSAPLDMASILRSLQQEMKELRSEVQQNLAQLNCPTMQCTHRKEDIIDIEQCHLQEEMEPPIRLPGSRTPDFKAGACQHNSQQSATDSSLESAFELLQQNVAQTIDQCLRSIIQIRSENWVSESTPQTGASCQYDSNMPCGQHTLVRAEKTPGPTLGLQPKKGSNSVLERRPSNLHL